AVLTVAAVAVRLENRDGPDGQVVRFRRGCRSNRAAGDNENQCGAGGKDHRKPPMCSIIRLRTTGDESSMRRKELYSRFDETLALEARACMRIPLSQGPSALDNPASLMPVHGPCGPVHGVDVFCASVLSSAGG